MIAVEARGLAKRFGTHTVFSGLDLAVRRGETVAILGPSGCGKSTLLRCIAGLESPDAGDVRASGELSYVFQEPRLFPWLTVAKNVAFAARTPEEHRRVDEAIALVGLDAARDRLPKHLSGGMAQRAALARALVRAPDVLLLDEPFAALDALRRLELRSALGEIIGRAHAAAILVTHDVDEAIAIADRVLVLAGTPARFVEFPDLRNTEERKRAYLAALGVQAPSIARPRSIGTPFAARQSG